MGAPSHPAQPAAVELDDYAWLVGPDGAAWLARVAADASPLTRLVAQLRRDLSAARAHLIVEQVELRRRAQDKFSRAQQMFFTRRQLEQATDDVVADYKAQRFPEDAPLADLCCGIGGDLLSLAARGTSVGIDRDPIALLLAEANCRAMGRLAAEATPDSRGATFIQDTANPQCLAGLRAWHIDPDRRAGGRRSTHVEAHDPPLETLAALLRACPHAGLKLAPAADLPEAWRDQAEWEWISRDGSCRQLVAWWGDLGQHRGGRRATVLSRGAPAATLCSLAPSSTEQVIAPTAGAIGRYVFEPDAAIIAAGLVGELAARLRARPIDERIAYLTSDSLPADAESACFAAAFEVLETLPFQQRRVKALLRERSIGRLEIKLRGVPYSVPDLARHLRVPGDHAATLLIFRQGDRPTAILARRMASL